MGEQAILTRQVLDGLIRPLLASATLSGPHLGEMGLRETVSFDTAHQLRIYPPYESRYYFLLKRACPFRPEEKNFIARTVGRLHEHLEARGNLETILAAPDIIEDIVALSVSKECHELVASILKIYGQWVDAPVAPGKAGHIIGIYLGRKRPVAPETLSVVNEASKIKALELPEESLIALTCDGEFIGFQKLRKGGQDEPDALAAWTGPRQRIGIRLTPEGSIFLYRHQRALFIKEAGLWHCLPSFCEVDI